MNGNEQKKKRPMRKTIISLIAFIVTVCLILLLIMSINGLSLKSIGKSVKDLFRSDSKADGFSYEDQQSEAFADLSGGFVTTSNGGFVVFDKWGDKLTGKDVILSKPACISNGSVAGIYDYGGKELFIVNSKGKILTYETDKSITSASVNAKGWFALCMAEENYKGSVTILNAKGKAVYRWYSGDGYILSAIISDNCKSMLAIKLNADGSEIVSYKLDSEEKQAGMIVPDEISVRCKYGVYGDITALTDRSLTVFGEDGTEKKRYDFSDYTLEGFSLDGDGYSVLYCGAYQMMGEYLITVDDLGNYIARLEVEKDIVDISASNQSIGILYSDSLTIYDKNLKEQETYPVDFSADKVIMRSDGKAIVAGPYSSAVLG